MFAKAALSENLENFVVHIASLEATKVAEIAIHPSQVAQIPVL